MGHWDKYLSILLMKRNKKTQNDNQQNNNYSDELKKEIKTFGNYILSKP